MTTEDLPRVMEILREEAGRLRTPYVTEVSREVRRSPFRVLVSCIISLRTKDEVTREASKRLFTLADTPEEMSKLPAKSIEKAIYPAGFYRNKARTLKEISRELVKNHSSRVPDTVEGLTGLKGVGRKTATAP